MKLHCRNVHNFFYSNGILESLCMPDQPLELQIILCRELDSATDLMAMLGHQLLLAWQARREKDKLLCSRKMSWNRGCTNRIKRNVIE